MGFTGRQRWPRTTSPQFFGRTTARWLACRINGRTAGSRRRRHRGGRRCSRTAPALRRTGTSARALQDAHPPNRYAAGRAGSSADILLFLHADSQSPAGGGHRLGSVSGTSTVRAETSGCCSTAADVSPREIVDSINAALNEAIGRGEIPGTLVRRDVYVGFGRHPPIPRWRTTISSDGSRRRADRLHRRRRRRRLVPEVQGPGGRGNRLRRATPRENLTTWVSRSTPRRRYYGTVGEGAGVQHQ